MSLNELREEINEIDEQLVELFRKRMAVVEQIANYKLEQGMQVLDRSREEQIIKKHVEATDSVELKHHVEEFVQDMMRISRKSQLELIKGHQSPIRKAHTGRVGFQGVEASFSHQALIEYFGDGCQAVPFTGFREVFEAIANGDVDYGVLPIENSSTGSIVDVYDLLGEYGCQIVGEKCVKVDHNLLCLPGTSIEEITEVYSHSQGFLQSREFFDMHKDWRLIPYHNTARSAQYVSESGEKHMACVASRQAAERYGLQILKPTINDSRSNHTRFLVIGKEAEQGYWCNKITVMLTLKHEEGSLYQVMKDFHDHGANMLKIESRPTRNRSWEYRFYIDFEGNLSNDGGLIKDLEMDSLELQLLGNYKKDAETI